MKKYIILTSIFAICISIFVSTKSYSWTFFNIFSDTQYSRDGLIDVLSFDPDKNAFYFPKLEGKDYFDSVDDLSICRRPEVRKFLYLYLTSGREYTKRAIINSEQYLEIINDLFEDNEDMPKELALLPLLESGFNPTAVSRSKAVGLWQFMAPTGKMLDLHQDKWIDERRNIEKSTQAAIRHLRGLGKTFDGDWELALAAYNGGAGHVRRSMNKAKSNDYWELSQQKKLRKETSEYVARFSALLIIYNNQNLLGIAEEIEELKKSKPKREKIETIEFNYPVNIRKIANLTNTPLKTIKYYNPELHNNITPPYYKSYKLRLPKSTIKQLKKNKKNSYQITYKKLKRHRVKHGECLSKIATNYHSTTKKIILINDITRPDKIKIGTILYIPVS